MKMPIQTLWHSFRLAARAGAGLLMAASAPAQNLFEADEDSGTVYEFTTNGVQSTFASGLSVPIGLAFNSAGDLFVACGGGSGQSSGYICKITPAGVQSTFVSGLYQPWGVAFNSVGNLFVACVGNQITNLGAGQIIEITPNGTQRTFASGFPAPGALAINGAGNLFVTVYTNANKLRHTAGAGAILEITPDGVQSHFASVGSSADDGLAFNNYGDMFAANDSLSGYVTEYTPAGSQSTTLTGLDFPRSIIFDSSGDMFVANSEANNIIELSPGLMQTTLASGLDYPDGLAFSPPPALQALGAGIQANQFGFTMIGSNNEVVVVETCTNLANPVWIPVATNTLTGGSKYFSNPHWPNYPGSYYRLFSP
jgi:hypothetical protein